MAVGTVPGRPLKFTDPELLQTQINAYFDEMVKQKRPLTIAGLAVHLDCSPETLRDYGHKEAFSATIKRAKDRCEAYLNEQLFRTQGQVAGPIFLGKNNYGMKDLQEVEVSGKGGGVVVVSFADAKKTTEAEDYDDDAGPGPGDKT